MTHLKLILEYFHPWPNSAGFFVARDQGWYQDLGLDVELRVYDPVRGDGPSYVLRGEADFSVAPTKRYFAQREARNPFISIAAINNRAMEVIQTLSDKGISRPRDLAHRRVGLHPTKRGKAIVRHAVWQDGGDPCAVQFIDCGQRELSAEELARANIDATFGSYWPWELAMDSTIPEQQRIAWRIDEVGLPVFHSYLLGVNEHLLHKKPRLVRSFLQATARGYQACAANPSIALPIYERITPYFPKSLIERSLNLVASTWAHGSAWGRHHEELLKPYAHWLARHSVITNYDSWREAYTNDFLPA